MQMRKKLFDSSMDETETNEMDLLSSIPIPANTVS